jgi:ParB family chromosome partitioning protein
VEPDPDQPRKDVGDIEDLKASILEHGIIQPCIVSVIEEDRYRLIAGERRYTAAMAAGLKTIPCVVRTVEEHRKLEIQIIENIHRKELNPVEEAHAYQRLIVEFSLSQRQLAARLGKSPASINETLRILTLPEDMMESVRTSERLTRSVLLEIAKEEDSDTQRQLLTQALHGQLTVKTLRKPPSTEHAPQPRTTIPFKTRTATVTVVFLHDDVTPSLIVDALSQALKEARLTLKASSTDPSLAPPGTPSDDIL